jgi:hypothetical protein
MNPARTRVRAPPIDKPYFDMAVPIGTDLLTGIDPKRGARIARPFPQFDPEN